MSISREALVLLKSNNILELIQDVVFKGITEALNNAARPLLATIPILRRKLHDVKAHLNGSEQYEKIQSPTH